MTIHFAAAANSLRTKMPREQVSNWRKQPANENANESTNELDDVLRSALLHLTQHGLDAPAAARRHAVEALEAGDKQAYDKWVGICRKFDRRAANALDRLSARVPEASKAQTG